ncbi:MAG: phage holin family protein [Crocinitomicaceae bacterium]|nr:phage holin family protein [Crocinitomicaceae bacterium]
MNQQFSRISFQIMLTALTMIVADYLMDGVTFNSPWVALVTALVLAVLNAFLKPLLIVLTIPATLVTFGLFLLVINAVMLLLAKEIVPGFYLASFWSAFFLALWISLVNSLFGGNIQIRKMNDDDFNKDN